MAITLQTKTARGKALWIERDVGPGYECFMLDCGFSRGAKDFIELPRLYRTERGAKSAAARMVAEKLKWSTPVPETICP